MNAPAAARLAWSLCALAVIFGTAGFLFLLLNIPTTGADWNVVSVWPTLLVYSFLGALVASRRPRNPIGWLFLALGVGSALGTFATEYALFGLLINPGSLPAAGWFAWLTLLLFQPNFLFLVPLFLLLFPDGRPPSLGWRAVIGLDLAGLILQEAGQVFGLREIAAGNQGNFREFRLMLNPTAIPGLAPSIRISSVVALLLLAIAILAAAASLLWRFRRAAREEREQIKWLAFMGGLLAAVILIAVPLALVPQLTGASAIGWALMITIIGIGFPAAAAIAILRYRLYEIDVVINRSLVFGALAAFITAVYVGIVVGIGTVIGSGGRPNLLLSIVATAVVAVAFQPVREWVQRAANRLVYGERATPYEVMAEFSQGMATVPSTEELLPRMAEAAGRGVSARQARVTIFLETENQAVTWPAGATPTEFERVVPIVYAGRSVGEIAVAMPQGAPLRLSDGKLLNDLSAQAGLAMHNVRLTLDLHGRIDEITRQAGQLRESRNRIVAAQDTERRRLEQSLDAGVHRELRSLADDLLGIKPLLLTDPPVAAARLDGLAEACNQALQELRDLARGIYPPLLRDQGLVAALRAQAVKMGIPIELSAQAVGGDRYSEEVEAAIYFSCVEALREARISATLTLEPDNEGLRFSVEGVDLSAARLQDIEDRVESLAGRVDVQRVPGGATTISGRIPSQQAVRVA